MAITKSGPEKDKFYTISLRLRTDGYRRLWRFATKQEQKTGERISHQKIIETALGEYLSRNEGTG